MKKYGYFVAGLALLFFYSCAQGPEELVLDSFEGEISSATVDYGTSEGSSLEVKASQDRKIDGSQSLKVEYILKPSGYMWVARGYNLDVEGAGVWSVVPEEVPWNLYNTISVYMYGRNTDGIIAFDIKDAGGELWRFILDDNFSGWKEMVCPFSQFFVRTDWQPQSADYNKVLDFPIMSFQFEPRMPGGGVFYFDSVKLLHLKKNE